jgi:hypothetical protein
VIKLGIIEDSFKHENGKSTAKLEKRSSTTVPTIQKKEQEKHSHRNIKKIFGLSFDPLRGSAHLPQSSIQMIS